MLSALKTKRARVGLGLLLLLAFSGAAVAYFSTTGAGSGNAQVGTSSALTITPTITPPAGGLVPGTSATVSFSVNNPGGGKSYVNTVSLGTVTAYSDSGHTNNITGVGAGKCDTSQFTMSSVSEGLEVSPGNTTLPNSGTLAFNDEPTVSQDGCKNAYLVATFTSN